MRSLMSSNSTCLTPDRTTGALHYLQADQQAARQTVHAVGRLPAHHRFAPSGWNAGKPASKQAVKPTRQPAALLMRLPRTRPTGNSAAQPSGQPARSPDFLQASLHADLQATRQRGLPDSREARRPDARSDFRLASRAPSDIVWPLLHVAETERGRHTQNETGFCGLTGKKPAKRPRERGGETCNFPGGTQNETGFRDGCGLGDTQNEAVFSGTCLRKMTQESLRTGFAK